MEIVEIYYSFINIYKLIMEKEVIPPQEIIKPRKSQLCRFYLRGLCMHKATDCYFSHGVWDLHFQSYTEDQLIIYDYSKLKKEEQYEKLVKGPRNYINLYEYQNEKIFTLSELNQDRAKRSLIRNAMHQEMFNDFMDLLQCYYPEANFQESFLIREFSRVGFNKTMSAIKIAHISSMVCDPPNSRFYLLPTKMPPLLNKEVNFIVPLASEQEIQQFYKQEYEQFLKNADKQLTESEIKKHIFSLYRPSLSIMPLNIYLKRKKMNFTNFLKTISNQGHQIIDSVDEQTLFVSAQKFIDHQVVEQGYCTWNDVYKYFAEEFKVNNANISNPIKPKLIETGYYFLNFPMIQMLSTKQAIFGWKHCNRTCDCQFQIMYPEEQLLLHSLSLQEVEQLFPPKQSFDIFDVESLLKCAPIILQTKILGIDLEGRLRKGGYIEMIQLNTGRNTFLIDVYRMHLNGDDDAFYLTKKIMRNIMCNPDILKIFHDCRHDSLALHEVMNTCIINIFDTSAVETFKGQLETYEVKKDNPKSIPKIVANVKTPGLNEILHKYHAPHGINKNKDWFHQLWKKGKTELFEMRPLDPDYREYCIKDVLDLPHVYKQMSQNLCPNFTAWISSYYVRQGYLYIKDENEGNKS